MCIPIYNVDVGQLTGELDRQLSAGGFPSEILLMDDASDPAFRERNRRLASDSVRYVQLTENIGRSRIRNRLAAEACYPYLIFMDCDSEVPSEHYIRNYLNICRPGIVCYGGRIYEPQRPERPYRLRWKYGVERESLPAGLRKRNANYGFSTNNFLIHRPIFDRLRFNEELEGYGHEDTFFGLELMAQGIPVEHIDNPLVHKGLERAEEFLLKTENGLRNLLRIDRIIKEKYPSCIDHSRLMRTYHRIERSAGASQTVSVIFNSLRPFMKRNLLSRRPSLLLFDLYKLGFLCNLRQ